MEFLDELFCFFRDRVSLCNFGSCHGTHSVRPGWPRTHKDSTASTSLSAPQGIKGMRHHHLALNENPFIMTQNLFETVYKKKKKQKHN